jgi:hypothetical protein
MADEHLASYLKDHLAGSVAALELLEHLEAAHKGTEIERFSAELRTDIEADRRELQRLMDRLQVTQSRPRSASAWLAGKFAELKNATGRQRARAAAIAGNPRGCAAWNRW